MNDHSGAPQVVEVQSFLSSGIDLKRLLKDVSKQSKSAVEALAKLLSSEDDKVKLAAAKALLELNVNIATTISEDQLKRLIAETRLGNGPRQLIDAGGGMPQVNFSEIKEI